MKPREIGVFLFQINAINRWNCCICATLAKIPQRFPAISTALDLIKCKAIAILHRIFANLILKHILIMKKVLLITMPFAMAFGLSAQVSLKDQKIVEARNIEVTDAVVQGNQTGKILDKPRTNEKSHGVTLGSTYYDLQTNSAVQDRLVMNSNGDISAAWTASRENSTTFSDRGTGYAVICLDGF